MNSNTPDSTTPDAGPQAPDFDVIAADIVDDYYSANAADGDRLQDTIAAALQEAHTTGQEAGQQDARANAFTDEEAALIAAARAYAAHHALDGTTKTTYATEHAIDAVLATCRALAESEAANG